MGGLTMHLTVEQAIDRLWTICDDGWFFHAASDQWWVVAASCTHGEWRAASRGAVDLATAFSRIVTLATDGHEA